MLMLLLLLLNPNWKPPVGPLPPNMICTDGRVTNAWGQVVTGRMAMDHYNEIVRLNDGKVPAKVDCK